MGKRVNTAKWIESQKRWRIRVQINGQSKAFYSSKQGKQGQREAHQKADNWLNGNEIKDIAIIKLTEKWLNELKETSSKYNYTQIESITRLYINPSLQHFKFQKSQNKICKM